MKRYFKIKFEFDANKILEGIHNCILSQAKAYVCVVDGNVLATATKDLSYRYILNNAFKNTCDGSSIAIWAGFIHRRKFKSFTGPELFSQLAVRSYKQLFLGNTKDVHEVIKKKLIDSGVPTEKLFFRELPFLAVEEFDYETIARDINILSPEIIWVSLGAPKQERFINNIFPLINKGVVVAIGAAFNLYINDNKHKRAPEWMLKLKLEWLYRSLLEPNRIGKRAIRYLILLPRIIITEIIDVYIKKKKYETISS